MPKKIITQFNSGVGVVTASTPVIPAPKTTPDTHGIMQLSPETWNVVNSESGSEVARFGNFADALAEQKRRNAIELARGIT